MVRGNFRSRSMVWAESEKETWLGDKSGIRSTASAKSGIEAW